jgi:NAD+ synthase (glutamine-hydrolysing)
MAFGPARICAYNMSTRFNSAQSKGNAAQTARALGIELREGSIEALVAQAAQTIESFSYPKGALAGLALENAQARIRGLLLLSFSQLEGGVVVNNGNRVEAAFGYATLYGDTIGAIAPIAGLTKQRVFDLAHAINRRLGTEAVPSNLLPAIDEDGCRWLTPPSAELAAGQTDPMKWFYHDWIVEQLDGHIDEGACEVLRGYIDDRLASTPAGRWLKTYGLEAPEAFVADLEACMAAMEKNAFKRLQAAPFISVASSKAEPLPPVHQGRADRSSCYRALRAQALALEP